MAKLTWTVFNGATDISSKILSMNITQGREKYLDNYSGGTCTFTINNAGDYASNLLYGNQIKVQTNGPSDFEVVFWVQEIDFNDYPGNTGLSTATITAVDWISRSGRVSAENLVLPQLSCANQLNRFTSGSGGPLPSDMPVSVSGSPGSTASANTYTGSVNNYLNLLVATERGYVTTRGIFLYFQERSTIASYPLPPVTLSRTASATALAYQTFDRIQNGTQFINTATVSPTGLASQTAVVSSSVTTYGAATYSSTTMDYNTTQGLGNASWIANSFSDPYSLRFKVGFSDLAQNTTALNSWMSNCWGATFRNKITLDYQVPGGSPTSTTVLLEGWSINITPEQTVFDLSYSPLQYYQFFTLDSTTLGILDTSRLGW